MKSKACLLLFLCLLLTVSPAYGQSADSFRTPEYLASTGLEALHAAEAYALGFTGQGVTVAVADTLVRGSHRELAGKVNFTYLADDMQPDAHGSHVSGIIAARKDNLGMHGLAFDAYIHSLAIPDSNEQIPVNFPTHLSQAWLEIVNNHPEIHIINNSLGIDVFLDNYGQFSEAQKQYWRNYLLPVLHAAQQAASSDKLIVFASGNEGRESPGILAGLPTFLDIDNYSGIASAAIANNWLAIGAFNSDYNPTDPAFIAPFSNMGTHGASEYMLFAPGVEICSIDGESDNSYVIESGTSMATPYASATAALVSQAFPYMGGKQLADVLLSTATPMNSPSSRPRFIALRQNAVTPEGKTYATELVFYSDIANLVISPEEANQLLAAYSSIIDADDLQNAIDNYQPISTDDYNSMFGQGIINAHKAVQGPGYLDANRLDQNTDLKVYDGQSYAMYQVDSKGYDSTWSNDIGQRGNDKAGNRLMGLDVGLLKQGQGILYLSGANTYLGPTVIDNGVIHLSRQNSVASLAGPVYINPQGVFTGNGVVPRINNQGTIIPGLAAQPGGAMRVTGDFSMSNGQFIVFSNNSGLYNQLQVGGNVNVSGGDISVQSLGSFWNPATDFINVISVIPGSGINAEFAAVVNPSPFIVFTPRVDANGYSLLSTVKPLDSLAGLNYLRHPLAGALQQMYEGLGPAEQSRMYWLYFMNENSFVQSIDQMRGDIHAASINNLPFNNSFSTLLQNNPASNSLVAYSPQYEGMPLGFWVQPLVGYSTSTANGAINQPDTHVNTRGALMGLQLDHNDFYYGLLAGVGDNQVSQAADRADINDFRLGLYGGWQPGPWHISLFGALGWQHYKTKRAFYTWDESIHTRSSYDGHNVSAGAYASYNLLHFQNNAFELRPYLAFDVDYIRQNSRSESGDSLFALDVHGKSLTRSSLRPGLSGKARLNENLSLNASVGYKRLLSGDNPELDVNFVNFDERIFIAAGPDESKDFFTCSLGAELEMGNGIKASLVFFNESSSTTRQYTGSINLSYQW